jgi:hypothetical protein
MEIGTAIRRDRRIKRGHMRIVGREGDGDPDGGIGCGISRKWMDQDNSLARVAMG